MNLKRFLLSTAVVTASLVPAAAFACNCDSPIALHRFQMSGIIPANAIGVPWNTNLASEDPKDNVRVERIEGENRTLVEFSIENPIPDVFLIRPVGWAEGNIYRVHAEIDPVWVLEADELIRVVEVKVGPPLDPLLEAEITAEPLTVGRFKNVSFNYDCEGEFNGVSVPVSMQVPSLDDTDLYYTTFVDGEVWAPNIDLCRAHAPGSSWVGRGQDLIVAVCDDPLLVSRMLAPGSHTVSMEARLPGTDIVYTTETLTVELTCPDAEAEADAGGDATDAGTDASNTPETPAECPEDTSGCQSTHGSNPTPILFLLGLLGWVRRHPAGTVI